VRPPVAAAIVQTRHRHLVLLSQKDNTHFTALWPVSTVMHVFSFIFVKFVAGVYMELVDARGHKFGPGSSKAKEVITQVDAELVRVLDALSGTTNINLMVFSDHGMAERVGGAADASSGLINVLDYINSSDWKHAAGSKSAPGLQIWPKSDNEDWVSLMKDIRHGIMELWKYNIIFYILINDVNGCRHECLYIRIS